MKIQISNFYHCNPPIIEEIEMRLNELLQINTSIKDQLNKAETEIIAKVAALQAAIDELVENAGNADLPEDVVESILAVQTAAQSLDDLNADETPIEPTV
jgi:predicted transcriptional regulator